MWKTVTLGEICDVLDSLRKPITKKDRIEGDYPYYGATGIVDWVHDYIFEEKLVLVGEDGAKWGAGDATAFIATGKYWVNNHAHVLRPKPDLVIHEWIAYYLTGIDLSEFVTGLTVPKLNQTNLKIIPIPLPPLAEQQRIVAKLDAAFAEIDEALVSIVTKSKLLKTLSVQSINEIITKNCTEVITKPLQALFKLSSGKFLPKKEMRDDGDVKVYGGNGVVGKHNIANLKGKNVVIGRVGAKCGNVHFVNESIWLTDNAMYVHSLQNEFNLEFLTTILASLKLGSYARQAAQPVISFSSG